MAVLSAGVVRSSCPWLSLPVLLAAWVGCAGQPVPSEGSRAPVMAGAEPAAEVPPEDPCAAVDLQTVLEAGETELGLGEWIASLDRALDCGTEDLALAARGAARLLELVERAHGELDLDLAEPQRRSCVTNMEGVCVWNEPRKKKDVKPKTRRWEPPEPPPRTPYTEVERLRLAAYRHYEAHIPASEALRERRYEHIALALEHNDDARARPLLEAYVADYEAGETVVWAATMLADVYAIELSMGERRSEVGAAERLVALAESLPARALWQHPKAELLRSVLPTLHAGSLWTLGMHARDRGSDAVRERDEASPEASERPPHSRPHFERCAEIYLEIYATFAAHPKADTLLWNAADCYDAAYRVGRAMTVREGLLANFADSDHARDTLFYLAETEESVGLYEDAAEHYLEFARRYPKDARSGYSAWLQALAFGEAVGRRALVEEAERGYIRAYKRKDVRKTGRFVWSRRPSEGQALADYAEAFLKTFGGKAGVPHAAAAELAVAEYMWSSSCRHRLDDGLCVARKAPPPSTACSLGGAQVPILRSRNTKGRDAAGSRLRRAAKLLERAPREDYAYGLEDVDPDQVRGRVAFLRLELKLEDWLAAGLDDPEAEARAVALDREYRELGRIPDADSALRALERRAFMWELLANRGLVRHEGECVPLNRADIRYANKAKAAYRRCLEQASEWVYFNDAAYRCEQALAQIEPEAGIATVELFAEPDAIMSDSIESVGVVDDPWLRGVGGR